jgi:zeaxanthin glucosyltransferase
MTHFAAIAPPFLSHLRAFEAIAWQLTQRGHRVTFVQQADVAELLTLSQADFVAIGSQSHPSGTLAAVVRRAAQPGPFGIRRVIADMAASTELFCREAPTVLRSLEVDAVLADQMEPAGALVAEHLGLPFISVACALPFNREPLLPLPVMPWRYRATDWGEQLNLHSSRVYDHLMRPHAEVIQRYCQAFGLAPRMTLSECMSPLLQISQTVAGFDFPRRQLPANFHGVGPLRRPLHDEAELNLPVDPARPFVFASLGTLQGHRYRLLRDIARACKPLGVQLLIAHCGGLNAAQAARLHEEGADWVTDFAAQRAALAKACAVITHAGLNTVLDALEAGVPMLALPIAFDQPGVAARIEHAGVGLRVSPRLASPARISRALQRLLNEGEFRQRAAQLGAEVCGAGGAVRAAELIEAALGTDGQRLEVASGA